MKDDVRDILLILDESDQHNTNAVKPGETARVNQREQAMIMLCDLPFGGPNSRAHSIVLVSPVMQTSNDT